MRLRAVVFVALAVTGIVLSGVGAPAVRAPETLPAVPTTLAALDRIADPPTSVATTTTMPPTTTTAPPPPTTTTTRPPAPVRSLSMYNGLGTWIDVYDWSATFGKDGALVDPAAVDQMARAGVQTLYVQTAKWDAPQDVLEPERLLPIIARAKHDGLRVVAWYLPTFEDPQRDMARLMAASRIHGVDALAVDIESLRYKDVAERNRRLVEISVNLRAALPRVTLGAIPYPPVATDVINPNLWPSFPWMQLAPLYDIWMPMSYQSDRSAESGYRDAYRYMSENIDRLRAHLGNRLVPVHAIGGIADQTSADDANGIYRAAHERHVVGGSLYDWRTTAPELWAHLQRFRA